LLQVSSNKRYAGAGQFTVSEVAEKVKADSGSIDILVSGCSPTLQCGMLLMLAVLVQLSLLVH
jgi:hypothetical protein